MKIIQSNIYGDNRVALLDENDQPVRFFIQRPTRLNLGDIVSGIITHKNTALKGYFAKTEGGFSIFIPSTDSYFEGQRVVIQITKEARLFKDANGMIVPEKLPAPAQDIALQLSHTFNRPIQTNWDDYDLDEKWDQALAQTVPLSDGASLHIERTNACWTIDVDTGSSLLPLHKINLWAAAECARQIMLRHLSGIILIDFAGPKHKNERLNLETLLQKSFQNDTQSALLGWTKTRLFEIKRQRTFAALSDVFLTPDGLFSPISTAYKIARQLKKTSLLIPTVKAHPTVINILNKIYPHKINFESQLNKPQDYFEIKE